MAEDAVADAFLAVHEHIGRYDPARPFKPWFYRILLNAVRAAGRRARLVPTLPDAPAVLGRHADPGPGPEAQALQRELDTALLRQIDQLPRKQREVIILRYYLDMDELTMATILDVPAGTVKWRLFQARNRLRRGFGDGEDRHPFTAEERQHV
jgi:RNA polymerase sigma-70 factor (ECF subfamily)